MLVSISDSQQSTPPPTTPSVEPPPTSENPLTEFAAAHILGDFLALLSALFYALYVILLKVRIKEESRIDMQLFFGFVGLFNILACWPIGLFLHIIGIERLELPYTNKAIVALLINVSTYYFVQQGCSPCHRWQSPYLATSSTSSPCSRQHRSS